MAKRSRQRFSEEFRAETVALVRPSGRPIADVCRELGIGESTVYRWLVQAEIDAGQRDGLTSAERDEMARLRRELRIVQEERDILAKAIAFFSKETTR
jgi:transposase